MMMKSVAEPALGKLVLMRMLPASSEAIRVPAPGTFFTSFMIVSYTSTPSTTVVSMRSITSEVVP